MSSFTGLRVIIPLFYYYYFFEFFAPIIREFVRRGHQVTVLTWDERVNQQYSGIPGVALEDCPRVVSALWNRSNKPFFRTGLWVVSWVWGMRLKSRFDVVILPFDNKPVWYVMSRLIRSVYCHTSVEFIDLNLTLEREIYKKKEDWVEKWYFALDKLFRGKILPRLGENRLRFFADRLFFDRIMGWRAPNHLCGFSGVNLLTVAGSENKEAYAKAGIGKDRIVVAGNPNFDCLDAIREEFDVTRRLHFKKELGIESGGKIFSFFLSPSSFSDDQIREIVLVVDTICKCMPNANIVIKFHPKTGPKFLGVFRSELEAICNQFVLIDEFSGDKFNAELMLVSDCIVQKQSTLGLMAMRYSIPVLSYNLVRTDYEDNMYKILGGSEHVESVVELKRALGSLFDPDAKRRMKTAQRQACEKFCIHTDSAASNIVDAVELIA